MPTCDEELLKDYILEMADDEVGTQLGIQLVSGMVRQGIKLTSESTLYPDKITYELTSIKTTETDADKTSIVCEGRVNLLYDGTAYSGMDTQYTAKLTDTKDDVFIEATFFEDGAR